MSGSEGAPSPPPLPRLDLRGSSPADMGGRIERWAGDWSRILSAELGQILAQRLLTTRGVMQGPLFLAGNAGTAKEAVPLQQMQAADVAGAAAAAADLATVQSSLSGSIAANTAAISAGDRWVQIADVVPTAVAAIDVLWTAGAYTALDLILTGILPAASGATANLMARVQQGGSFVSGATAYHTEALAQEGATVNGQSFDASAWYLQRGGTAAALDHYSGRFLVDAAAAGGEPGFTGQERHSSSAGARAQRMLAGSMPGVGAIDGLRLIWESGGNFAATGRVQVLGLKA